MLISLLIEQKCFLLSLYPRDVHLGILEQSITMKYIWL